MKKSTLKAFSLLLISIMTASCTGKGGKVTELDAAGATFPLPYYTEAFKAYEEVSNIHINYGAVGSGGGIRSLKDEVVNFAATDAFLSDEELAEMPRKVIHIPTCMGAVVIAYNCPEISQLNLSGEIIADIYLGKITRWNDPAIAAINPDQNLPDKKISPVYRSDGSGTTNVFSDYLTRISVDWATQIGTGKSLKWPIGMAAKGNHGVAGVIAQTDGTLGYIGSEYSFSLDIPTAKVQNQSGSFVLPSIESISAAAAGEIATDTRQMITNSPHPDAYPISCLTWIIAYQEMQYDEHSEGEAIETARLLNWMLSDDR